MFPVLKCHYFRSNIPASEGATIKLLVGGGGGRGEETAVLYLNKLFVSLPISELYFFHTRPQAKYLFH